MSTAAGEARITPASSGKKSPRVRDASGRFVIGCAPGPGRRPTDPNLKQLAAADRERNFEFIRGMRDDRKMDPELRFEAAKLLAMYSDGKPTLGMLPNGPLVSMNFGAPASGEMATGVLTPEQAYAAMCGGTLELDPDHSAFSAPRLPHAGPARAPIVVDATPAPATAAPAAAAPGAARAAVVDDVAAAADHRRDGDQFPRVESEPAASAEPAPPAPRPELPPTGDWGLNATQPNAQLAARRAAHAAANEQERQRALEQQRQAEEST